MAKVDLQLACRTGHHTVRGESYGPFAVHKTLLWDGEIGRTYTLTHVRTGHAVTGSITRAQALTLARKLVGARLNWKFSKAARMPKRTHERGSTIVKAFLVQERGW